MYGFIVRDKCPVCHSANTQTLYNNEFKSRVVGGVLRRFYHIDPAVLGEGRYWLEQCQNCEALYQREIGDATLLHKLYSEWQGTNTDPDNQIDTYRRDINNPRMSRDAHELMAVASYLKSDLKSLKTLDYGMGWALWARIAKNLGCDSYGTELDPARVSFAANHGVRTLSDDELSDHHFDFISTEQVMEHVTQPLDLTRRLAASLKPGGILKVSVPAGTLATQSLANLLAAKTETDWTDYMPIHPLEHINTFVSKSLGVMAAEAGLVQVQPSLAQRFAFMKHRGAISPLRPKMAIKEMVRPFYTFSNTSNLHVWLRRPA